MKIISFINLMTFLNNEIGNRSPLSGYSQLNQISIFFLNNHLLIPPKDGRLYVNISHFGKRLRSYQLQKVLELSKIC